MHGNIAQDLAVDLNIGFLQTVGKLAVGQAALTGRRVDTGNPQLTKDTFFGTTITGGILPGLHHRFFGDPKNITAATAKTFCKG